MSEDHIISATNAPAHPASVDWAALEALDTMGISTVARTWDTLDISIPLFTAVEVITGVLMGVAAGTRLIDHNADARRSTDLVLTFRLPPSREPADPDAKADAGEVCDG
jgi:hypothetical protein